jgi:branched-subunit amino acid transport protein
MRVAAVVLVATQDQQRVLAGLVAVVLALITQQLQLAQLILAAVAAAVGDTMLRPEGALAGLES